MNRTIIRSTLIVLAALAVSVSVKAQSAQQYSADIPFDFEARGQQHAAGKYKVGSLSVGSPGAIGLRQVRSQRLSILGVSSNAGSNNWDKPGTLTFLKVDGKYYLTEIATASFKMKMKEAKTAIREIGTVASVKVPVN